MPSLSCHRVPLEEIRFLCNKLSVLEERNWMLPSLLFSRLRVAIPSAFLHQVLQPLIISVAPPLDSFQLLKDSFDLEQG